MSMRRRVAKLEAETPDPGAGPLVLMVTFVSPDPDVEDEPGPATIMGYPERIWPLPEESRQEFGARVNSIAKDFMAERRKQPKNRNLRGRSTWHK